MPVLSRTTVLRRLILLLALCVGPVALVGLPAVGAHAAVEHPTPPLSVTAAGDVAPRYGDVLVLTVRSTGSEVGVVVRSGSTILASGALSDGVVRLEIPTVDRFLPETTYRLDVEASNEASSGATTFSFTPTKISASIQLSNATTGYRSLVFGALTTSPASSVTPTGRIELVRRSNGFVIATYDIRTDGTFALRPTLAPGTYQDLEVRLRGSAFYADTAPGSGSGVTDLTVTALPTTTVLDAPTGWAVQGEQLLVTPSTTFGDPYTEATLDGRYHIYAKPDPSRYPAPPTIAPPDYVEIAGGPVTQVPMTFDLTTWAATHEGNWLITASYDDDPYATSSSSTPRSLKVRRPGRQPTQTMLQLDRTEAVVGQQVTGFANITGAYDYGPGGTMVAEVDGREVVRRAVSGTFDLTGLPAGTHSVVLRYLGNDRFEPSTSGPQTLTVVKASTHVTVEAPTGEVRPGAAIPVRVTADAPLAPTGSVTLLEGGRPLATTALIRGGSDSTAMLTVPALAPGRHEFQVRYDGDEQAASSASGLLLIVAPDPVGGPAATATRVTKVKRLEGRKARLTVHVTAPQPAAGVVVVRRGKKIVGRATLRRGIATLTTKRLPRGRANLIVTYAGSPTLLASAAKPVKVRIR